MYKSVFKSSKIALLFAGMTLVSAVSMIGTSEDAGMLTETVQRIEERSSAFAKDTQSAAPARSEAEEAEAPVFGDYTGKEPAAQAAAAPARGSGSPMDAPLAPTAKATGQGSPAIGGTIAE
jgi:hypothetical protein